MPVDAGSCRDESVSTRCSLARFRFPKLRFARLRAPAGAGHSIATPASPQDRAFTSYPRTAHLEIIGFWRPEQLARRLELLARYGPSNLILAVSKRLARDKGSVPDWSGELLTFAQIVPAKKVLAAIERIATE